MAEKWISKHALLKALGELRSRSIHPYAAVLLGMKKKGVRLEDFVEYTSHGDQQEGFFIPYLVVGKGKTPKYYRLFDGKVTPGSASNYAHSSTYTPWRQRREQYIRDSIEWRNPQIADYYVRFKPEYLKALPERFFEKSEGKKIPLAALAIYLQARSGAIPRQLTAERLVDRWTKELHLTQAELSALFDDGQWAGPEPFQDDALSAQEAIQITLDQAVIEEVTDEEAPAQVVALYSVAWDEFSEEFSTSLAGVSTAARRALAAIRAGKHVILLGPPGTGKTQLAEELCDAALAVGVPGYLFTTATAEWTTFETIGGYLPEPGDPSSLEYLLGIVSEAIDSGRWVVIDELNRADIDKAFGELFTVLSGKRVSLPFKDKSGGRFVIVPPGETVDENERPIQVQDDWRMIGTMNTFDKASLFQLSFAFMRRFAFVEVPVPDKGQYSSLLDASWPEEQGKQGESEKQSNEGQSEFRKTCLDLLKSVFLPEDGALALVGLPVGPAIPLDVMTYLDERFVGETGATVPIPLECVLEGLEMFLYPQFEGQDRKHKQILAAISSALGLDDALRDRTERSLSVWTGYEEGE